MFAKRGIDVNVTALGSGAATLAAVVGASADVGIGSLWPVYQAYARGLPLRIVAPGSLYAADHPDAFLLVRKDSGIVEPRDLDGKIVGGDAAGDIAMVATRAWLDQHGGDGKSIRTVDMNSATQLGSLQAGRIDAAVLKTPFLTTALESGLFRQLGKPYDAVGPRFLLSCWVASADFIAKNPADVRAFADGLREAAHYTNAHQDATIPLVAAFTGLDPNVIARGIRSTNAEFVSLAELQRPLDFAYKYGVIGQHIDVNAVLAPTLQLESAAHER